MIILTILSLSIQEHSIPFHQLVWPSVYSISISQFLKYSSFASLGNVIPRSFITFDAMVNEIMLLISLSDTSLLVYRNATDFYV